MSEGRDESREQEALRELLVKHREAMVRIAGQIGGGLLRYETAEDLVQGVQLHALHVADHFTDQGDAAFIAWIRQLIRQHIARRHQYWSSQKRDAGAMLRISVSGGSSGHSSGIDPSASRTGPATFADRREQFRLAMQALEVLSARDRAIVRLVREGRSTAEIAEALALGLAAAEKARSRAMERFRKTYALLNRS